MRLKAKRLTALAVAIATLSGCQTNSTMQSVGANHGMVILCGVGAVGGAILGNRLAGAGNKTQGAVIGGLLGGALGCYAGSVWESKMKALQQIAKDEHMAISVQPLNLQAPAGAAKNADGGLVAQVQDEGMFPVGSAQLTTTGLRQAQKLAAAFAQKSGEGKDDGQRRFLIVGHTDATGTASLNQRLSEQRARAVGQVLQGAGIAASRIYYQGAGSSRPVADNTTEAGRNSNRRVEISEMSSQDVLVKRVQAESANAKYAVYSAGPEKRAPARTSTKAATVASRAPVASPRPVDQPTSAHEAPASAALVNFGGVPAAQQASVTAAIQPKSGGFTLISSAQANDLPIQSCQADAPRETGSVLSLATGQPLEDHKTYEYMAGYNNRVWAEVVNGNLLTITPVSILKDNAAVDRQPILEVVKGYDTGNRTSLKSIQGIANTYEGETQVLYRVFAKDPNAPVSCIDVVFEKGAPQATKGQVFYPRGDSAYVAAFIPRKAS